MTAPLHAVAPAKINLSLRIVGKRADGYHLLDSIVAFTDFGDVIDIEPDEQLCLLVDGPCAAGVPTDERNLVLRAATALAATAGIKASGRIRLTKNLPAAGGIGGGSSDAAATLRLLNVLWGTNLDRETLDTVALTLGADVPVCLNAAPCRMHGIGEIITPISPFPALAITLVHPGIGCNTSAVFRARRGEFSPSAEYKSAPRSVDDWIKDLSLDRNDLTEAAIAVCPEVRAVLNAVDRSDNVLLSRMSGSGSTCFGLYPDRESAEKAATELRRPGWWTYSGSLLPA